MKKYPETAERCFMLRTMLNLTQRTLADMCEITVTEWSNYEMGIRRPGNVAMTKIKTALPFVDLNWLIRG